MKFSFIFVIGAVLMLFHFQTETREELLTLKDEVAANHVLIGKLRTELESIKANYEMAVPISIIQVPPQPTTDTVSRP